MNTAIRPTCSITPIILVAALFATSPAHGQAGSPPPKQDDSQLLSGPKVSKPAEKPTLVKRDFNGNLTRLEIPPEEAALPLLTLSDDEKQATRVILTERAALWDKAVSGNIPMLLKLQGFRDAKRADKLAMLREWNGPLQPVRARGKLVDELAGALAPANAAQLKALTKEYWDAAVEESMRTESASDASMDADAADAKTTKPQPKKAQIAAREYLLALGGELKRTYDRVTADGAARVDQALKAIDATPEQTDKIKNLNTDYFQKTLGKPTDAQKRDHFTKILAHLTPDQKKALLKEVYGK